MSKQASRTTVGMCIDGIDKALLQNVETNDMPVEQEIQHLCALADIFKRSAIETLNIYNLLRASGLYNICLVRHSPGRHFSLSYR